MAGKRRKWPSLLLPALLGLLCAAILGAIFYGTMVYQLAPEEAQDRPQAAEGFAAPPPLEPGKDAAALFPGPLLALATGALQEERAEDAVIDGEICRTVTRLYSDGGTAIEAVSAQPSAYIGRLAMEGWTPQLIAGCELAQLEAVYAEREDRGLLAARDGERVYLLIGPADEQRMYALGAACLLE